jgi:hypothetical protein
VDHPFTIDRLADDLHDAYATAVRETAALPPTEKAIVVNALVRSSRAAKQRLGARSLAPASQARLDAFSANLAGEDVIAQGISQLNPYRDKLILFFFACVAFVWATAGAVVVVGQKGPDTTGSAPTRPTATYCLAGYCYPTSSLNTGSLSNPTLQLPPAAIVAFGSWILTILTALAKWWQKTISEAWEVGTEARGLLARLVDAPERALFQALQEPVPTRWATEVAGPLSAGGFLLLTIAVAVVGAGLIAGVIKF